MATASTPGPNQGVDSSWTTLLRRMLVSGVTALLFFVAGGLAITSEQIPAWASLVTIGIGLFLLGIGLYMTFTAVSPSPRLVADEEVLVTRHPTMKPAYARMMLSIPFLAISVYLLCVNPPQIGTWSW